MKRYAYLFTVIMFLASGLLAQNTLRKMDGVNFSKVNITDNFWKPKIEKVSTATLNACIYQDRKSVV